MRLHCQTILFLARSWDCRKLKINIPSIDPEVTEEYIDGARLDKDNDRWILTLGDLYSEVYAQWFDSLRKDVLIGMPRNYEKLIVVDHRTTSNFK